MNEEKYQQYVERRHSEFHSDSDALAVYQAEDEFIKVYPEFAELVSWEEVNDTIKEIINSDIWKILEAPTNIEVKQWVNAEHVGRARCISSGEAEIELDPAEANIEYIIHELAHCAGPQFSNHHVLFRQLLCLLFEYYADKSVATTLRNLFKKHGLKMKHHPVLGYDDWKKKYIHLEQVRKVA